MHCSDKKISAALALLISAICGNIAGVYSDLPLRYIVGIPQNVTYREGDASVMLQWALSPVGAIIFNLKCYHGTSINAQKKAVISSNVSGAQSIESGLGRLHGRGFSRVSSNHLQVTISSPGPNDEGWYFCDVNTAQGTDVTGAIKLSRQIDTPYLIGIHQKYKYGDHSTVLQWIISSTVRGTPLIRCFHSPSFHGQKQEILSNRKTSNTQFALSAHLLERAKVITQSDKLKVIISNPQQKDEGWYFCDIYPMDIKETSGALELSRRIDNLEAVASENATFTRLHTKTNLTWRYFPKSADMRNITCFYKLSKSKNWVIAIDFMVKDTQIKPHETGHFLNRMQHSYKKGTFTLMLQELSPRDEGIFDCKFTAEDTLLKEKKISSKLHFSYKTKTESLINETLIGSSTMISGAACRRSEIILGVATGSSVLINVCLAMLFIYKYRKYQKAKVQNKNDDDNPKEDTSLPEAKAHKQEETISLITNKSDIQNDEMDRELKRLDAEPLELEKQNETLAKTKDEVKRLREQLEKKDEEMKTLKLELEMNIKELSRAKGDIESLKTELTKKIQEVTNLSNAKTAVENKLTCQNTELSQLRKELENCESLIKQSERDLLHFHTQNNMKLQHANRAKREINGDSARSAKVIQKGIQEEKGLQRMTTPYTEPPCSSKMFSPPVSLALVEKEVLAEKEELEEEPLCGAHQGIPDVKQYFEDVKGSSLNRKVILDGQNQKNQEDYLMEKTSKGLTDEELQNILASLDLSELFPTFKKNKVDPSLLRTIPDVFYKEMGVDSIGDIIHLRHYDELKKLSKKNVPDIFTLLTEINCQEHVDGFYSQKVEPDDFQYLKEEHFNKLGVKEVEQRTRIRTTTRDSTEWTNCCMQRRNSHSLKPVENITKPQIQAPSSKVAFVHLPPSTREAGEKGDISEKTNNSVDQAQAQTNICQYVEDKYKEIFGRSKFDVKDSGELGAVVLLHDDLRVVVCLVSGIHDDYSNATYNLLQNCFSRYILKQIHSEKKECLTHLSKDCYKFNDGVKILVYITAPPCRPSCINIYDGEQQNSQDNSQDSDCLKQISEWRYLGFQGPLLSNLMGPVYISALEVKGACHHECLEAGIKIKQHNDVLQKMPPGYQDPIQMKVIHLKTENNTAGQGATENYKYWYDGQESVTIVNADTGKSVDKEEESQITLQALLNSFKKVYSEAADKKDDLLKLGSENYQKAKHILKESEKNKKDD